MNKPLGHSCTQCVTQVFLFAGLRCASFFLSSSLRVTVFLLIKFFAKLKISLRLEVIATSNKNATRGSWPYY